MFPSLAVRSPRALSCAALFAMMLAVSACGGGGGGGTAAAPPAASVQAPVIATQPVPQTVAVGQAATFSVAATGDGLSYQWQRNGTDIAGATAASYVLNNAQASDDGSRFTVVVRNAGGSATSAAATLQVKAGQLSLLAGAIGGQGDMDGPVGRFTAPSNIVTSPSGELYVNDFRSRTVLRKITQTPGSAAVVTTLPADQAYVLGAVDAAGNRYENWSLAIHKATPAGVRTLLAGDPRVPGANDGAGSDARFQAIGGMAIDAGGTLYVADRGNATIRKVSPAGVVTTLAGSPGQTGTQDGTGAAARFRQPMALVLDKAGNIYVEDDTAVRKLTPAGVVTTLATVPRWIGSNGQQDKPEPDATFPVEGGLAVDAGGNVYILSGNIRRVSPEGVVTNFAGSSGSWSIRSTMTQDAAGNMYVVDYGQAVIYRVSLAGDVSVIAGLARNSGEADGAGAAARFDMLAGVDRMHADAQGNVTLVEYNRVRRITAGGVVSTLPLPRTDGNLEPIMYMATALKHGGQLLAYSGGLLRTVDSNGNNTGSIAVQTPRGLVDGPKEVASMSAPRDFIADSKGNIYFRDWVAGAEPRSVIEYIRRIGPDGAITTVTKPPVLNILDWTAAPDGKVYITTASGQLLSMAPDGALTTLRAAPSPSESGSYFGPLATDSSGNLYVALGSVLHKITPAGVESIVAGTPDSVGVRLGPLPASLNQITAIVVGDDGAIYMESENAILKLTQ